MQITGGTYRGELQLAIRNRYLLRTVAATNENRSKNYLAMSRFLQKQLKK